MKKSLVIATLLAAYQTTSVAAGETTGSVVQRAEKAFAAQLTLTRAASGVENAPPAWIAKDAVYQYALRGIDVTLRVEGRTAVAAHLRALAEAAPGALIENVHIYPTLEPEVVFVQYDLLPQDGVGKRTSPLAIIEMRGEQIVKFTQLSRSSESLRALVE